MLSLPASIRIFIARDAVDFRKAHDGLIAIVRDAFGDDPFDGSLFVFLNRGRNRVKLLYWDGTGLWVMTKRLEQGTFAWPKGVEVENGRLSLRAEALALLLDGVDLRGGSLRPWYQR